MKIVQLCPYDMRRPGGVQRHVADLARWLTDQGHETRIIAPPAPGQRTQNYELVTEVGRARHLAMHGTAFELSYARPKTIRALRDELHDWRADVVHMHTPWTPMLVWQAWRALRLPTVSTIHATLPDAGGKGLTNRYIRRTARYFMQHSQAVVTPSEAPLDLLRRLVPDIKATVLPPAVDLSDWRSTARSRNPDDPIKIVSLGRLEARKGVEILLEAWQHLAPLLPHISLTIGGDGALRDKVERAAKADARHSLRYIGRPDDAEARALVKSADLFIAPAPYGESFGIVLAEAMAAGTVPIAAANPGYASVLTGTGTGLLVPRGDAKALANLIESFAANPQQLKAFQKWGMTHADQFDIKTVGPKYLGLYKSLTI